MGQNFWHAYNFTYFAIFGEKSLNSVSIRRGSKTRYRNVLIFSIDELPYLLRIVPVIVTTDSLGRWISWWSHLSVITTWNQTSCLEKSLVMKWFYGLEGEKNYRIRFLPTSGISSSGISQGKIISVNWLLSSL